MELAVGQYGIYQSVLSKIESNESGNYDIGWLATGTYRMTFYDMSGKHITEYYNNKSSLETADDIQVTAGQTVSGINASLVLAGHITGRVTGPDGVMPLQEVEFEVDAYTWNASSSRWDYAAYDDADESGNYDIAGLATGTYRVKFRDGSGKHATEYYNKKTSLETADTIPVTAGQTVSGINASLVLAGHITGRVTGPDGVTPLQGIRVSAYIWNASSSRWDDAAYVYEIDESGNYDIAGLATGTYRVEFRDRYGKYATEYYNNKPSLETADDIQVTAGQTVSSIDASLKLSPRVSDIIKGIQVMAGMNVDISNSLVDADGNGRVEMRDVLENFLKIAGLK